MEEWGGFENCNLMEVVTVPFAYPRPLEGVAVQIVGDNCSAAIGEGVWQWCLCCFNVQRLWFE